MMIQSDILIIGTGAAGLMAAKELSAAGKKVVVLEARDRAGGRIHTITGNGFSQPVETGAEFIHGKLELTLQLLKEAGIETEPASGAVWRSKDGRLFQQEDFIEEAADLMQALDKQKSESSVADFLNAHFHDNQYEDLKKSVRGYVEGYYAGEMDKASVLALKEEWEKEDEPQYRVHGGYARLVQALYDACLAQHCTFYFSTPVTAVTWAFEKVEVTTAGGSVFKAQKVIITVPVSVLQDPDAKAGIRFQPQLLLQQEAICALGFGSVIKILIEFKSAFWTTDYNLKNLGFLFSEEAIPTWWTQHPRQASLLVGWCAGPRATALKAYTGAQLFQKAIQSLAHIFNLPATELETRISAWKICNWASDPYTLGGYSYITTKTKDALALLAKSVAQTIYFAGEALYDDINVGTVETALQSGKKSAATLLQTDSL